MDIKIVREIAVIFVNDVVGYSKYICNNELKQLLHACSRQRLRVFDGTDY